MSTSVSHGSGKTPGQMLKVGAWVVIIPVVVIVFLIAENLKGGSVEQGSLAPEDVAARIVPVAKYNTGVPYQEEKSAVPLTGEQVYQKLCTTCHSAGLNGAPVKGNAAAWAPRIAEGAEGVYNKALHGFNAMPAKGGDASLSDLEVKRAVNYMVNASGGHFDEPAADAPAK